MRTFIIILLAAACLLSISACGALPWQKTQSCTVCGEKLREGDYFCPKCGAPTDGSVPTMLDGDRTYVANDLVLPYLVGSWRSSDGRWELSFGEDRGITLRLEGAVMLSTTAEYVHLEPGGPCDTFFTLGERILRDTSGVSIGELSSLEFLMTDSGNNMELFVNRGNEAEIVLLSRRENEPEALGAALTGVYVQRTEPEAEDKYALRIYEAGGVLLLQNCLYMNDPEPTVYSLWMKELWPDDPAVLLSEAGVVTGTAESFWVPFVPGDNPTRISLTSTQYGLSWEESLTFSDGEEFKSGPVEFDRAEEDLWFMPSSDELRSCLPTDTRPEALVGIWAADLDYGAILLKLCSDGTLTYAYKEAGAPIRISEGLWCGDGKGGLRLVYDTVGDEDGIISEDLVYSLEDGGLSIRTMPLDSVLPHTLLPDFGGFTLYPVGEDWCFPVELRESAEAQLELCWPEELPDDYLQQEHIALTDDEYTTQVAFLGRGIRDLTLYRMHHLPDGFKIDTVYEYGELGEDVLLVVDLTFYGDLPSWAVGYSDSDGSYRLLAFDISGRDGSLELYDPNILYPDF